MNRVDELLKKYNFSYLDDEGCFITKVYECNIKTQNNISIASHAFGIYLKEPKSFSRFHRLSNDEFWHFYEGDSFKLHILYPDGKCETVIMGKNIRDGELLHKLVPAGAWQAGELIDGTYALFGCTVAPAFSDGIFELRDKEKLSKQFPKYKEIINRL